MILRLTTKDGRTVQGTYTWPEALARLGTAVESGNLKSWSFAGVAREVQ